MTNVTARVIRICSDSQLVIDAGREAGVRPSMRFAIQAQPAEITDLQGRSVGSISAVKGHVVARQVFARFSLVETERVTSYGLGHFLGSISEPAKLRIRQDQVDSLDDLYTVALGDTVVSVPEPEKQAAPQKDSGT